MSSLIEPERDIYNMCLIVADKMVEAGEGPPWFRKYYYTDGELEPLMKYGLSAKLLATQALALALSYNEPVLVQPSKIKKKLMKARAHLKEARRVLISLSNESRPQCLNIEVSWTHLPDGSAQAEFWLDPYEDAIDAIDRFLERSAAVGHQGGGRRSFLRRAVSKLIQLLEREGFKLPTPELEILCQDLFDRVRQEHEGKEGPFRYHDMLTRMTAEEGQCSDRVKRRPKNAKPKAAQRMSPRSRVR
jgi:hypothetical protein